MQDVPVINLIRNVRVISPDDIIGRAAEAVRVSGISELPVVSAGRLVGTVTEAGILDALSHGDPLSASERPVGSIMSGRVDSVDQHMTIAEAARILDDLGFQSIPVVNKYGTYLGLLTRSDVISALCLTIRPPSVGGLATPLGVYLTTGNHRAGSSDLGLFLTGIALGLLRYAAVGILIGALWLVGRTMHVDLLHMLTSHGHKSIWMDYALEGLVILGLVIFGALLKFSPLSGYHAAEHQVVNAIENGEPLKPEYVELMPRVHPRCGTNILSAVILFLMISDAFGSDIAVLATILLIIFAWRTMGAYFQNYVTTKRPSRKQLESGIKAGREIIGLYRKNPARKVTPLQRIWFTGMPQVMGGMMLTMSLEQFLHGKFPGLF